MNIGYIFEMLKSKNENNMAIANNNISKHNDEWRMSHGEYLAVQLKGEVKKLLDTKRIYNSDST